MGKQADIWAITCKNEMRIQSNHTSPPSMVYTKSALEKSKPKRGEEPQTSNAAYGNHVPQEFTATKPPKKQTEKRATAIY